MNILQCTLRACTLQKINMHQLLVLLIRLLALETKLEALKVAPLSLLQAQQALHVTL